MRIKQTVRDQFARIKNNFLAFLRRRDPAEYFIALMLVGLTVFVLRCLIGGSDAFLGIFFERGEMLFYDFFAPVRDAAQGLGVYTEMGSIYPPLSNLIIFLFSRFLPAEYLSLPREEFYQWSQYPTAILTYILYFSISLLVLALLLGREKYTPAKKSLFIFLMLCSFPFVFLSERGNTVILCIIAMLIYTQNYNSQNPAAREFGLFMLAVATGMKFYPVLLGLPLLADKRWKDAIHACVYGLLCFLIPSFFYNGPISIFWSIKNTLGFSGRSVAPAGDFMASNGISAAFGGTLLILFYLFVVLFAVFAALIERKPWKSWLLCGIVMLTMPSIFSSYNWLLLLPAIVAFFRSEKLTGRNWLYFFLLTVPFFTYPPRPWQDTMLIVAVVGLYLLSVIEAILNLRRLLKERKEKNILKAEAENA
ncbi:MAG: DUF2029 domain-containing protein [Ruminococcaceae bacterium]|nr:DUF2029 domain-containing protein [Oscillospiraceae bacterium]